MGLVLWSCPALRARLTESACAASREAVERDGEAVDLYRRHACTGCPGVRALHGRGETEPPRDSEGGYISPDRIQSRARERPSSRTQLARLRRSTMAGRGPIKLGSEEARAVDERSEAGLSVEEIAREIGRGPKAVRVYLERVAPSSPPATADPLGKMRARLAALDRERDELIRALAVAERYT